MAGFVLERFYDTDKVNGYLEIYQRLLAPWVDKDVKLLELGVHRGGSLLLWYDYFPHGDIVGIDKEAVEWDQTSDRIHVYQGLQEDTDFLGRIARRHAPEGFDIIIDDASHLAVPTRIAFWYLFVHHLKPGGLYVIEDWGTGYWDTWPDGKRHRPRHPALARMLRFLHRCGIVRRIPSDTHRYGMVGLIKELIDEQGYEELSRPGYGQPSQRQSRFDNMVVTSRLVAITKAATDSA